MQALVGGAVDYVATSVRGRSGNALPLSVVAKALARWVPAVAYVVVNGIVSDLPGGRLGVLPAPDWLLHGLANVAFGASLRLALAGHRRSVPVAIGILAAHGALDEWHQSWVPGRTASLTDWIADVVGGLVGLAVARRWRPPPEQRLPSLPEASSGSGT